MKKNVSDEKLLTLLKSKDPTSLELAFQMCARKQGYDKAVAHKLREYPLLCVRYDLEESYTQTIKKLNLSYQQLTSLPAEIGRLKSLEKLFLNENLLMSLPPEIGLLQNLQELNLQGNQLKTLPLEMRQLKHLKVLNLSYNKLTHFPSEVIDCEGKHSQEFRKPTTESLRLTSLNYLDLEGNQITSLPPEIGQLKRLKFLYLSENQLTSIPPEIGQLRNLIKLRLGENRITFVPSEIKQLRALRELSLEYNQLTSLPSVFKILGDCLKKLKVYGNPLPAHDSVQLLQALPKCNLEL